MSERKFEVGDKVRFLGSAVKGVRDDVETEIPIGTIGTITDVDESARTYPIAAMFDNGVDCPMRFVEIEHVDE
jgi:hypothetical protein